MNKILLSLMFVCVLSLTTVASNQTGYGIEYWNSQECIDSDGGEEIFIFGNTTQNYLSTWNNTKQVIREDYCLDNLTLQESTCYQFTASYRPINCTEGCSLGKCNPLIIPNETEPTTPTIKKKSSGGGSSNTVKCEEYGACINGTQTQLCEKDIFKTRACEMPVKIIQNENGKYADIEDIDKVDVPEPNTNKPAVDKLTELKQPEYKWPIIILVISLIGLGLLVLWIKRN